MSKSFIQNEYLSDVKKKVLHIWNVVDVWRVSSSVLSQNTKSSSVDDNVWESTERRSISADISQSLNKESIWTNSLEESDRIDCHGNYRRNVIFYSIGCLSRLCCTSGHFSVTETNWLNSTNRGGPLQSLLFSVTITSQINMMNKVSLSRCHIIFFFISVTRLMWQSYD